MSTCIPCTDSGITLPSPPAFPAFPPPLPAVSSTPTGGSTGSGSTCPAVPILASVSADFTTPAIDTYFQIYSQCAYLWAIPGLDLMIAPFGRVSIAGVSGDVLTVINRTITADRTILTGTKMTMIAAWDVTPADGSNLVDSLIGFVNGRPQLLGGAEGFSLKRVLGVDNVLRWQALNPGGISGLSFNAITPTIVKSGNATQTITLPNFPSSSGVKIPVLSIVANLTLSGNAARTWGLRMNGTILSQWNVYGGTSEQIKHAGPCILVPTAVAANSFTFIEEAGRAYTVNSLDVTLHGWYA